jgi:hypothetical protein
MFMLTNIAKSINFMLWNKDLSLVLRMPEADEEI